VEKTAPPTRLGKSLALIRLCLSGGAPPHNGTCLKLKTSPPSPGSRRNSQL
jgi:hypothetical protein